MTGKGRQNVEKPESGGGKAPKNRSRNNRFNPIANNREPTGEGEWTEVTRREGGNRPRGSDNNGNHQRNTGSGQQNQRKTGNASRKPEAAKNHAAEDEKPRDYCVVYSDQALGTEGKKYWNFSRKIPVFFFYSNNQGN